jgi:hypothetical protein
MTQRRVAVSYRIAVALGVAWMAISCGGNGASNNDQGMSVTFLGLFGSTSLATNNTNQSGTAGVSLGQLGCGQLPASSSGGYIVLGDVGSQPSVTVSADSPNGIDPAGNYLAVIGVQNNLYGQAFRVETVEIEYYIPGASIQPPSASVPAFLIAGPAESTSRITSGGGNQSGSTNPGLRRPSFTSLPPSFSNLCNRALAQVTIVPRSVIDWLSVNRGSLPPAPYALQAIIRLSGQSSAGDRIDTNEGLFELNVLPDDFVVPVVTSAPEATTTAAATGDAPREESSEVEDLDVGE